MRQHQIHDDGGNAAGADGVFHQHVDARRQHLEDVRVIGDAEPQPQRGGDYQGLAPIEAVTNDDATTGDGDHGEHDDHGPTHHRRWYGGEEAPYYGEEPQQHQHDGDKLAHMTGCHPGHLDHPVVLGKGGQRQGAECRGDHRYQTVGQHAAGEAFLKLGALDLPPGDHCGSGNVTHCFQHAQQIDGARQQKGVKIEGETVLERNWHSDKRQVLKGREIHHAEHQGHRIAHHQTDSDPAHAKQGASAAVEGDDDAEHQQPQPDVLVFAKGATAHG